MLKVICLIVLALTTLAVASADDSHIRPGTERATISLRMTGWRNNPRTSRCADMRRLNVTIPLYRVRIQGGMSVWYSDGPLAPDDTDNPRYADPITGQGFQALNCEIGHVKLYTHDNSSRVYWRLLVNGVSGETRYGFSGSSVVAPTGGRIDGSRREARWAQDYLNRFQVGNSSRVRLSIN